MSVVTSVGARPILMYVISVDADGTREKENNLSSIASFQFINTNGETFKLDLTEFVETSFQYYNYVLPTLEEDAEGSYILTLGWCVFVATFNYV